MGYSLGVVVPSATQAWYLLRLSDFEMVDLTDYYDTHRSKEDFSHWMNFFGDSLGILSFGFMVAWMHYCDSSVLVCLICVWAMVYAWIQSSRGLTRWVHDTLRFKSRPISKLSASCILQLLLVILFFMSLITAVAFGMPVTESFTNVGVLQSVLLSLVQSHSIVGYIQFAFLCMGASSFAISPVVFWYSEMPVHDQDMQSSSSDDGDSE